MKTETGFERNTISIGRSLALTIPHEIVKDLDIQEKDSLEVKIQKK